MQENSHNALGPSQKFLYHFCQSLYSFLDFVSVRIREVQSQRVLAVIINIESTAGHECDVFSTGQVLDKSVGIKKTLEAVKDIYDRAKKDGKAVGIACGIKNTGIGNGVQEWGKARLVVEKDENVSRGGAVVETDHGTIDARIERRFAEVEKALKRQKAARGKAVERDYEEGRGEEPPT